MRIWILISPLLCRRGIHFPLICMLMNNNKVPFFGVGGLLHSTVYKAFREHSQSVIWNKNSFNRRIGSRQIYILSIQILCLHPRLLSISPSSEIADCFIVLQSSRQFLFFSRILLQNKKKKKIILSSKDTTLSLCLQHLMRKIDWSI